MTLFANANIFISSKGNPAYPFKIENIMKTTRFIIKETQNLNSDRVGFGYTTDSLVKAKSKASTSQCFHDTTLKIEYENGSLVAYKEPGKKWVNI